MENSSAGKVVVLDNCGDDAECGVGGTIASLTKAGWEVIIGRFNKPNEKTGQSSAILKAREEWLEFPENKPDTRVDTPENAGRLEKFLLKHKPDIIFTYWPIDEHFGHRAVATMTIRCMITFYSKVVDSTGTIHSGEYCPELYFYEVLTGKQTKCFHPDTYVDVTEVIELKKQAMLMYKPAEGPAPYFNSWYPHQILMLEFRGRESGAIGHAQIDKGVFAEAFMLYHPIPPGHERICLPGMK